MSDIVVNIGNTNIRYGIFTSGKIKKSGILKEKEFDKIMDGNIERIYYISVNEKNKKKFMKSVKIEKHSCFEVKGFKKSIETKYNEEKLGIDRIVNIWLCQKDKIFPAVLIDTGTADTYDFIDANGVHIGGFINCGLTTLSRALDEFTDSLPLVHPEFGEMYVGQDTESALRYGLFMQWISGVISMVKFGRNYLENPKVIITGGNSKLAKDFIDSAYIDENFTLNSIYKYAKENCHKNRG